MKDSEAVQPSSLVFVPVIVEQQQPGCSVSVTCILLGEPLCLYYSSSWDGVSNAVPKSVYGRGH